jgi:hypothetical protein
MLDEDVGVFRHRVTLEAQRFQHNSAKLRARPPVAGRSRWAQVFGKVGGLNVSWLIALGSLAVRDNRSLMIRCPDFGHSTELRKFIVMKRDAR